MKQLWAEWQDHLAQRLAVSKKLKAFVAKSPQREAEAREILKTGESKGDITNIDRLRGEAASRTCT